MNVIGRLPVLLRFTFAGTVCGIAAASAVTLFAGTTNAIWWWPAGTVALTFAGFAIGLALEVEVQGGRADRDDEMEARRIAREVQCRNTGPA